MVRWNGPSALGIFGGWNMGRCPMLISSRPLALKFKQVAGSMRPPILSSQDEGGDDAAADDDEKLADDGAVEGFEFEDEAL